MNIENLKRTRDRIAAAPDEFLQFAWPDLGDRPVGIAGFAAVACGATLHRGARGTVAEWEAPDGTKRKARVKTYATLVLELDARQAESMFAAKPFDPESGTWIQHPNADQAIALLDRAMETGEVRWRVQDGTSPGEGRGA